MFYIVPTIDPADLWDSSWSFIWRTLVGNSRRDRSVQFSGFLVHELPLWKRMRGRRRDEGGRWRNMLAHKGRKGPRFSVDGLLSNTRVHISISAMHDKTPGWTGDDKNEEEPLSHSNRAIFGSSLRQRLARHCQLCLVYINKKRCNLFKEYKLIIFTFKKYVI